MPSSCCYSIIGILIKEECFVHNNQVRVNALRCLGDLVSTLDKQAILDIVQTLQRCTAVDRSAPTLMCTLGVSNAIFKEVSFFHLFFSF